MTQVDEQKQYEHFVNLQRKEKRFVRFWQLFIFSAFFIVWEIASRFYWIDPLLFSAPSKMVTLLWNRWTEGQLLIHIQVTVLETMIGFFIGTVVGIILATCLWASRKTSLIADPYLVILNAMPKVALGPIIIVAFGPSYLSIIMMGALVSLIITTIVVYSSFIEVDENYITVLRSFQATRRQIFIEAIFPASLPTIISTFKVNVGLSWVGIIVGEFLVSKQGLGYLIIYGFQVFDFTLVMASLLLIALFAALMYKGVEAIEILFVRKTK